MSDSQTAGTNELNSNLEFKLELKSKLINSTKFELIKMYRTS